MPYKSLVTALTAQNATETTKTLVDTVTVPGGCTKLIGVGPYSHPKGFTTLECVSGICELESDDTPWDGTQQFQFGVMNPVGAVEGVGMRPYIHPTDVKVFQGQRIRVSFTYDMALTITPSSRCQLIFA